MSEFVISDSKCVHETEKAILVSALMFDEDMWIPKSVLSNDSEVYKKGTTGDCIVSGWFAEKEGWT